jgi:hypothetical protein
MSSTAELPRHLRKPRLRRAEAREYLEVVHGIVITVSTLAKWACQGAGPRYEKFHNSPMYRPEWIDEFVAAEMKVVR